MADLEWDDEEDNDAVNIDNEGAVSEEEEKVVEEPIDTSQTGKNYELFKRRNRMPRRWMKDYVTRDGLLEEEDVNVNLTLFASADPVHFEEVVKHEK